MAVLAPTPAPTEVSIPRRRFSIDEYERMIQVGILTEDERVELIRGEIVAMSPIGTEHSESVTLLTHHLVGQVGRGALVSVQNPIRMPDDSEPQPDFALVRVARYRRRRPSVGDVFLVVEVADSSLAYDRTTKLPLYAAGGIPEAWIFDLNGNRIERHTDPGPAGYRQVVSAGRGETLASTVLASVALSIDDVLEPNVGD